ncbi:SCO family protein [Marinimicrobium sp. LS-A18]|uniref:SCO family protein n=1 Tax=Marinimicrobium sp. LS-A18 TaxID=1381596 RepID=UPI000465E1FD|nr:SCO family protein [Marinimicrobium sp. LS-A18]
MNMNGFTKAWHWLAALGLWALAGLAFAGDHANHGGHDHHGHHNHHTPLGMASDIPEGSLHQFDATWQTHRGETLRLSDLAGQPVIVTMMYASCTTACPVLVEDVRRIHQGLSAEQRDNVTLLLVSFDTENDSVEVLNEYAHNFRATEAPWHFATGSAADVRTLAALLGIRYRKNPSGGYDHSNVIALLNADGEVIHRREGLNQPVTEAVNSLR